MKQCKCGGIVRQHALTNGREAWTCGCCKRYEIVQVAQVQDAKPIESKPSNRYRNESET